jgi:hypothetical protein
MSYYLNDPNQPQPQQNYYGNQPQPNAPQPPQKRSGATKKVIAGLGALVVVGAIGSALSGGDTESEATTAAATTTSEYVAPPLAQRTAAVDALPTTPVYVPPPAPAAPPVPTAWNKDGKYKIGKDIQPGEYAYTVKKGNGYWATCADTICAVGEGMIENDWIPTAGATGYLYIPADATMIELKDLRLEPTGG